MNTWNDQSSLCVQLDYYRGSFTVLRGDIRQL